ncbi:MAG: hypothetical protein ACJ07L_11290 [Opitutales bacterium]
MKPIPSFSKAPYVHPLIIKDFVGWVSGKGVIIQSVNLLNAQNSNRYFSIPLPLDCKKAKFKEFEANVF